MGALFYPTSLCMVRTLGGPKISAFLAKLVSFAPESNLHGYLDIATVSVFVLTVLWYFRTYDTRQQIYQSDLFKGIDNLASDDSLQVDIGVALLIEVSKKTSSFNEIIKTAFVRRLKKFPASHPVEKTRIFDPSPGYDSSPNYSNFLSYSQHIIRWLIEYKKQNKGIEYHLDGMDLSYQEFNSDNRNILFSELINPKKPLYNFSFYYIDPYGLDLSGLSIQSFDSGCRGIPAHGKDRKKDLEFFQFDYMKALRVTDESIPGAGKYHPIIVK